MKSTLAEMVSHFSFSDPAEIGALGKSLPRYNGAPTQAYPKVTPRQTGRIWSRVSRSPIAIALVMLFTIGARLGKYMGRSPWPTAAVMTAIGSILVAVTIAFGG